MKTWIGAGIFFVSFLASAAKNGAPGNEDLDHHLVINKVDGSVFMEADSCAFLVEQVNALVMWKHRLEQSKFRIIPFRVEDQSPLCEKIGKNNYRVKIDHFVTDWVKQSQGQGSSWLGPNCWNAALVMTGIVPAIHYSSDQEMKFWMDSPLCKKLKTGDRPLPGDVMAIRDPQGNEVHALVYVSGHLVYSKDGSSAGSLFGLYPMETELNKPTYKVPYNCRGLNSASKRTCDLHADYFHCISLSEYLADKPEVQKKFACLAENYCSAENIISGMALKDEPIPNHCASITDFKQFLCETADPDHILTCDFTKQPELRLLQQGYQHRRDSLEYQIDDLKKKRRSIDD